jgi:hypothetical protein
VPRAGLANDLQARIITAGQRGDSSQFTPVLEASSEPVLVQAEEQHRAGHDVGSWSRVFSNFATSVLANFCA